MINLEGFSSKGILKGVLLDGRPLGNWTACLTNNFIPDYQAFQNSSKNHLEFKDLVAKYATPERLLSKKRLEY